MSQNSTRSDPFFKALGSLGGICLSFYLFCLRAQVKSVNLSEGEQLSIRGADERGALLVLANHTLLVEGQVIRSPTNTLSVYYRSTPEGSMGVFQLHYQSECDVHERAKPVHKRQKYI